MEVYYHRLLLKQFLGITYSPRVSSTTRATETLYHLMLLAQTKMTADINDYYGRNFCRQLLVI